MIGFTVYGIPAPKGSTTSKYVPQRGRTFTRSPKSTQTWEALVREVAQNHVPQDGLLDGPLAVSLQFYLPKPASAPKRRRIWPTKKPDLDKLVRAVLDGLRGIIITDDARVVRFIETGKDYGDPPRCEIRVWHLEELEGVN